MITETRDLPSANRLLTGEDHINDTVIITCRIGWGQFSTVCATVYDARDFLSKIFAGKGNFAGLQFYSMQIGPVLDLLRDVVQRS